MCGIIGVVNEHIDEGALKKAIKILSHRGPDGYGVYVDPSAGIGFAHARLAIIDLNTGDQPLFSMDKDIVLICNGEIYDFEAIRDALQAKGHRFQTKSDSEVIIYLYRQYGMDFFTHLRGEFAFLLYDRQKKKVLAVRDYFGIKPLYYARTARGFVFSSEAKGLFATRKIAPEIDVVAVRDMMSFVPVDTIFEGVYAVPPGACMTVDLATGESELYEYWAPNLPRIGHLDEERNLQDWTAALGEIFDEAVRLRLRADVPVGVYLSGGIDSAGIAGSVARFAPRGFKVFSIAFTDSDKFNESAVARRMAQHLGAEYYEVEASNEILLNHLEESLWYSEIPTANCHGVGKFLLSELAREHVKVVLTGEGCDELFLGYDYFKAKGELGLARQAFFDKQKQEPERTGPHVDEILDAVGFIPQREMTRTFSRSIQARLRGLFHRRYREKLTHRRPIERLKSRIPRSQTDGRDPILQIQYFSIRGMMAPYILSILGDRQEMAHSIEGRPAILDHHLFEAARQVPVRYKIHDGMEKFVFREMVKDRITDEIYSRKKWPYSAPPLAVTKGYSAAMERLIDKYLSLRSIRRAGIFDPVKIAQLRAVRPFVFFNEQKKIEIDALLLYIITVQVIHHQYVERCAETFP